MIQRSFKRNQYFAKVCQSAPKNRQPKILAQNSKFSAAENVTYLAPNNTKYALTVFYFLALKAHSSSYMLKYTKPLHQNLYNNIFFNPVKEEVCIL